jgi:hypothetical protein
VVYTLKLDAAAVQAILEATPVGEVIDTLVGHVLTAEIDEAEIEKLKAWTAKQTGTGPRIINRLLKEARAAAAVEREKQDTARRIPVIGYLGTNSADADYKIVTVPFLQGLKETGYVEGQNIAVEYRWAETQIDRLPALAADLVRHRVAVIVATGFAAARAAKAATRSARDYFGHRRPHADRVHVGAVAASNGRERPVTSKSRSQFMPNVPTIEEAGYPEIKGDSWVGILVPAGTPKDIIASLNREILHSLGEPDMKERLAALGYYVVGSTPDEFSARIKLELDMWAKVIRAANINRL